MEKWPLRVVVLQCPSRSRRDRWVDMLANLRQRQEIIERVSDTIGSCVAHRGAFYRLGAWLGAATHEQE
jgi:hypothetical protein